MLNGTFSEIFKQRAIVKLISLDNQSFSVKIPLYTVGHAVLV